MFPDRLTLASQRCTATGTVEADLSAATEAEVRAAQETQELDRQLQQSFKEFQEKHSSLQYRQEAAYAELIKLRATRVAPEAGAGASGASGGALPGASATAPAGAAPGGAAGGTVGGGTSALGSGGPLGSPATSSMATSHATGMDTSGG